MLYEVITVNDKLWGTYMHGLFDNDVVINDIFRITSYNVCYTKLLRSENGHQSRVVSLSRIVRGHLPPIFTNSRHCRQTTTGTIHYCRITSYNVCYTKLLREYIFLILH